MAPVHAVVQLPQWAVVLMSVSQPLTAIPSQSPWPRAHAVGPIRQTPFWHERSPLPPSTPGSALQSLPHCPQFVTLVARSTHSPPQSVACPAGHSTTMSGSPSGEISEDCRAHPTGAPATPLSAAIV